MAAVDREPICYLPAGPFREWLHAELVKHDGVCAMASAFGLDECSLRRIMSGEYRRAALDTVDQAFVAAGVPELLTILYPLEVAA